MKVVSTQVDFIINNDGTVESLTWKLGKCLISHKFLSTISRFNIEKFRERHQEIPDELNICFIGYWMGNQYVRSIY